VIAVPDAFADSYAKARANFLKAAATAALPTRSFTQIEKGLEGEDLAIDVAFEGHSDAPNLLILSCGTQGADGFAGSAIESFLLHDQEWHASVKSHDTAVLYVHAVNPWGMSHLTFGDAHNINFVRNFVDFEQALPANPGYEQLHEKALTPPWDISAASEAATQEIIKKHGLHFLLNIHQRGQYTRPNGFYYGGTAPSWAHLQWRKILQTYGRQAKRIAWVDMRRGWGVSSGQATLVANASPSDEEAIDRARDWWAAGDNTALVARPDALQTLIPFGTGNPVVSLAQECPQAQYTGLAAYFSVVQSMQELSFAARSAQWLQTQGQPSAADAERCHAMMRAVSFKADSTWQGPVIAQGRQIAFQALAGLAKAR
jgi:hypothetical protein